MNARRHHWLLDCEALCVGVGAVPLRLFWALARSRRERPAVGWGRVPLVAGSRLMIPGYLNVYQSPHGQRFANVVATTRGVLINVSAVASICMSVWPASCSR